MRAGVGFETRTRPCRGSGAIKGRGLGGGWVELVLGGVEWISPSSSSSRLEGDSSNAVGVSPKLVGGSPAFDGGSVWLVGNWGKMVASSFRSSVASLLLETNFFVSEIGIRELVVDPLVVLLV